jgi:5-formaminoimidazole-4-carboxamide-1-(beta)-D-ribofuranosyl 5'-monophosphate synthetase
MDLSSILTNYDTSNLTIASLGGHSALDVCHGAKKHGFKTLVVAQKGREKTYDKYYKTRDGKGCIDDVILVDHFSDVLKPEVQEELRKRNAIFIHNRYFWVYFKDFDKVEKEFMVPIYGNRELVKLEERDQPNNQYELLQKADIRIPKIIRKGDSGMNDDEVRTALSQHFDNGGGPVIVKVNEATRSYERAFFIVTSAAAFFTRSKGMIAEGKITQADLDNSVIEEFVMGAQINFNYFYSNMTGELELMGTDTRRQTSLDGFLRLDAETQMELIEQGLKPSMIETGHIACTTKESILEKAFTAGEKFIETLKKEVDPGMIGPFALQGAIAAENGREEIVIFDVSMRIPGSPGTRFTPLTGYLYGETISYGERIAIELKDAAENGRLNEILT